MRIERKPEMTDEVFSYLDEVSRDSFMLQYNQKMEESLRKKFPDWSVSDEEMLAVLLASECCAFHPLKTEVAPDLGYRAFTICVLEYDFFAPGYTAYTPIDEKDIRELYRFHEKDPEDGRDAWLCKFYGKVPWDRMKSRIEASGIWNCAELAAQHEASP